MVLLTLMLAGWIERNVPKYTWEKHVYSLSCLLKYCVAQSYCHFSLQNEQLFLLTKLSSSHEKWLYTYSNSKIKFVNSFIFFLSFFNSSNSHKLVQGLVLCKQFFTLRMLLLKSRYCVKYHRSLPRFYTVCHHCSSYSIESHLALWYSSQVFSMGKKSVGFF